MEVSAVRAGTETKYHFGDDESRHCDFGNHLDNSIKSKDDLPDGLEVFCDVRNKSCSDGVGVQTASVGTYQPNEFGLYDMHGNVSEWVRDCWNESYRGAPADGSAWQRGDYSRRVLRGGSWISDLWFMRSASRLLRLITSNWSDFNGFRVARTITS